MIITAIYKEDRNRRFQFVDVSEIFTRINTHGQCELVFASWGHKYSLNTTDYEVEIND